MLARLCLPYAPTTGYAEVLVDAAAPTRPKDADTRALEKRLSDALGLTVSIDHKGEAGTLHIHYHDLDQLDDATRRLEGG